MLPLLLLTLAVSPPLSPVTPRFITLSADVKVAYAPTKLSATFQFLVKDRDASTARKQADEKQRRLVDALIAAGAAPDDVRAYDPGTTPEYRGAEVVGHFASRNVTLALSDLTKADAVFTAAHKAGANQMGTTTLSADPASAEQEARVKATSELRARATTMLELLGAKLGLPRTVTEVVGGSNSLARAFPPSLDGTVATHATNPDLSAHVRVTVQFDIRDE